MDPDDNTAIVDMKMNFQKFMKADENRKRSRLDLSETNLLDSSSVSVDKSYGRDPDALRIKTDLIYCKSRIGMLESQLNRKETDLKEQAILHEREISELKRVHDRELRGYSVLKTSHERVLHRQELCEKELADEKSILLQVKNVFDEKIGKLQKRDIDQDMSHTQIVNDQNAKFRELRNRYLSQQADLSIANSKLVQLKEQLSELKHKLNDSLNSSTESDAWKIRATQSEERVSQLEAELGKYRDDMKVMAARKQDLAKLVEITEQNKKLHSQVVFYKVTVENIEVMKERLHTMERQLKNHEELQAKAARLQVENESYGVKIAELQHQRVPEDIVVRLREAQEKEAVMVENLGELKSRTRLLEHQIQDMESSLSSCKLKDKQTGDDCETKGKELERLQRKVLLLSKERDGYKQILDSYESDVTREVVSYDTDKASQLQQTVNSYVKAYEELEKELQLIDLENTRLKETNAQLQSERDTPPAASQESTVASRVDQCQLLELRQQVASLAKECEKLMEEKDVLEARIEQRNLQGDYDPTQTKVLHLKMNPLSVAQQNRAGEVSQLRDNNVKLRERIRVLEGNLADAHNITAQVEANLNAPSAKDTQLLKETKSKLASHEKRYEKMMEMFKKTSLEFRQVVYQLTGFRIDVPKSKQYKLMNMYANSSDDYLLFQETSEGEVQLLETEYAATLVELAEEHLRNQQSIPVFLSSLTLDLYKQSTMTSSMLSV